MKFLLPSHDAQPRSQANGGGWAGKAFDITPPLRVNSDRRGAVEKAFVKGATPLSPLVRGVKAMPPDEGVEEKPP